MAEKKKVTKNTKTTTKKVNKEKVEETKLSAFKRFMNNPLPMLIVLTLIIIILLLYIANTRVSHNKIYIGNIQKEDLNIVNIHYFANDEMNYFYAGNALYLGKDAKIYGFQIGYYVEDSNGEYHEFATRSGKLDKASSLKDVVLEQSGWNFGELPEQDYFFDDVVVNNLDNLHFLILATTDKDKLDTPDIRLDYKVELTKLNNEAK